VIRIERRNRFASSVRLATASAAFLLALTGGAWAQGLIPTDFFNAPISSRAPAAVEADSLVFEGASDTIRAQGGVVLRQGGYTLTGDDLVYDRRANTVRFQGAVTVRDPLGNLVETQNLQVEGEMRQAFVESLTITTYDGARITADSVDYDAALQTLLQNASYSPCGDCIDAEGRRIGWSVSAARIVYNSEDGSLYLEQPTLALLGMPVAWLPYLWLPDTSDTALENVDLPNVAYSDETGLRVQVPVRAYSSRWTDVILTPTLVTRQGFLLGAELRQRFDSGSLSIKASGLYQFDPEAFDGEVGERDWRGAIQSVGRFRPVKDWTVGWSYTAFSDAAYLPDYDLETSRSSVNEVYATNVTDDTYLDMRLQTFNLLGDKTEEQQDEQGRALPNVRWERIHDLGNGMGRIEISGRLLGVARERDDTASANGVPYVFGTEGGKQHASLQAGWQTQWIGAGGFVATPYLGGRADLAYYNGESELRDGEESLLAATPIAALDVRYPLLASGGDTVHIVEPIAQLVYRGSDTTAVGITNDDAQSFVFDDTNLFSFNRFSGNDRQETGLRANIGGRYQANFVDGGYVELIAGQSFQIAGANAFSFPDPSNTGIGSGLENDASYAVLGAYGSFSEGLKFGGKLQIDTDDPRVARAGFGATYRQDGYSAALDYNFIAAEDALGVEDDQHEVGVEVGVPIHEYWTVTGEAYWDLAANTWLQVGGGLVYDDGYLVIGANAVRTGPTHVRPDDTRFLATFRLRAPAGLDVGIGED
jgi:LPS-assembly protein